MVHSIAAQIEEANEKYASEFDKGLLPVVPQRHFLVVSCMDSRVIPEQILGLEMGDAHVIRNGGGRAPDALRSIIPSQQLLETREIIIMHHTDCGYSHFTDEQLKSDVRIKLGETADHMAFMPFDPKNIEQSVRDDMQFLKKHPLVLDVPITGYIYDVTTGKIQEVYAA